MSQVTVISGVERRREWTDAQKMAPVASAQSDLLDHYREQRGRRKAHAILVDLRAQPADAAPALAKPLEPARDR